MPSFLKERSIRTPLYGLYAVMSCLFRCISLLQLDYCCGWVSSCFRVFYLALQKNILQQQQTEEYIATLSYRLKKVGEEALLQMPIGIMLINDDYYIEWTNPFLASCFAEDTLAGRSLYDIAESLIPLIKQEIEMDTVYFK